MDINLAEQLVQSMFRFRKTGMMFPGGLDASMGELIVMQGLEKKAVGADKDFCISDIHKNLHITKPAVSQIYSSLEKKGYINRKIDTDDRRKIIATLTPKGQEILEYMKKYFSKMLDEIITRMGEEDSKQLIYLFNRFSDISEDIKHDLNLKI